MPPRALRLLFEISGEADGPALGHGPLLVHQLPDRREDGTDGAVLFGELFVQSRLKLGEAPGQLAVGTQQFAQVHEGAHDIDAHRDRTGGVQDVRCLDGAVLGEGVRQVFDVVATTAVQGRNLRP
jgi:hypothetical protein